MKISGSLTAFKQLFSCFSFYSLQRPYFSCCYRKEKRRRDENELKHRHTSRVEADSGGERERGSGGESGATIKIKE